ncbi:hypothetical protein KVR01_002384 [Diaporthe batatas]|uniref:uncharacterized protein n=1 Tax=Diaporthe batatas TaxID=748121 RepID=UPI001D03D113|nr:uncharacterized protein KVR01_002384 [Diaporthe batatas]KAG8166695.1 hypothetical protein KVR01_002384 [Diaporthe batatas]
MAEQAAQVEGAEPPPQGQDVLRSIGLAITVLALILPIPFLLVRIYTPWKLSSPLRVDDWPCAAAVLFGIAYLTSGIVFAEHGGGHHVWEVTVPQLQSFLETAYWNSIAHTPAALFIKCTLLLIAVRAFRGNRLFTCVGYGLVAVMVGYHVPLTVFKIMTCRPIRGYWDYSEESNCYDYRLVFLSDAIGAVITDILVMLIALPLILLRVARLKMYLMLGAGSVSN